MRDFAPGDSATATITMNGTSETYHTTQRTADSVGTTLTTPNISPIRCRYCFPGEEYPKPPLDSKTFGSLSSRKQLEAHADDIAYIICRVLRGDLLDGIDTLDESGFRTPTSRSPWLVRHIVSVTYMFLDEFIRVNRKNSMLSPINYCSYYISKVLIMSEVYQSLIICVH